MRSPSHAGGTIQRSNAADGEPIIIGVVNNMPDAAVKKTEAQYTALLAATPLGRQVRFRWFFLPEIPRSEAIRAHFAAHYKDFRWLRQTRIDGLIVTGAQPLAPDLTDEPYWNSLTKLIDWAADSTVSAVWSCLAAHAVVLHMDGVKRRPRDRKLSGVFECRKVADHPMLAGFPARWPVPHSRYNDLPEADLDRAGYLRLSTSVETGADLFIKQLKSLFVFMHGHLEYEPRTLLREFRRDVSRFLSGENDSFPDTPAGYFDKETVSALHAFRRRAEQHRGRSLLQDLPKVLPSGELDHGWREPAVMLFRNWLAYLMTHRTQPFPVPSADFSPNYIPQPHLVTDGVQHRLMRSSDLARAGD